MDAGSGTYSMLYQAYQLQDDLIAPTRFCRRSDASRRSAAWSRATAVKRTPGRRAGDDLPFRAHPCTAGFRTSNPCMSRQSRCACQRRNGARPAIRQASALRQGYRYAPAAGAGDRPAVGPFLDAAARHGDDTAARSRRLYHRLGQCPRRAACRPAASAWTTMSTTSSASCEAIGPGAHILAVCQPCVQALAAVAVMSEDGHPATPRSMTLMAGPIDPRESPTEGQRIRRHRSRSPGSRTPSSRRVPWRHAGGGRRVYPGFLQLVAFMAMNMDRHTKAHRKLLRPSGRRRDRRGREDQDFLRRVFRGARPHRGILYRNHRPRVPEGGARHRRLTPSVAAWSTRARSATPRC